MSTTDPDDQDATKPSFRDSVTAGLVQKALEPLLRAVREEVAAARREVGARAKGRGRAWCSRGRPSRSH